MPALYSPPVFTLGRTLLFPVVLFFSVGSFIADFNETHVYNPNWPPHARFHNGQTMSLSVMLGLATLYLGFRSAISPAKTPATLSEEALHAAAETQLDWEERDALAAAIVGSMYTTAGLTAAFYPGALFTDPEFGQGAPQAIPFAVTSVLAWLSYWFESTRIANQRLALGAKTGKWD